jgi:hypothetical protein
VEDFSHRAVSGARLERQRKPMRLVGREHIAELQQRGPKGSLKGRPPRRDFARWPAPMIVLRSPTVQQESAWKSPPTL